MKDEEVETVLPNQDREINSQNLILGVHIRLAVIELLAANTSLRPPPSKSG